MASASAEKLAERHNAEVRAKKAAEETPGVGHNSAPTTAEVLKSYLDRRVSLEQDKKNIGQDIRELNAEAEEHGVNPRALAVLAKREMEDADQKAKREALAEQIDSYSVALGLLL